MTAPTVLPDSAAAGDSVTINLSGPDPLDDEELEMMQERRRRHSTFSDASGSGKGKKRERFIKSLRLSSEQIVSHFLINDQN